MRLAGIKVILINVPTIERLKNWQEPNVDEFNEAENKIASYGIKLANNQVFVTMISSRLILAACGIEGLPVMIAVKRGEERYRAVGENAVQKMNFSDQKTFREFLEIWDESQESEPTHPESDSSKIDVCLTHIPSNNKKLKEIRQKHKLSNIYGVNVEEANWYTRALNKYDYPYEDMDLW
jgi:hypothetical protein